MMRKWLCQADVTVHIEPQDPVLIKSGYATIDAADMVPVRTFVQGRETYYFPGTSLKGVLRSQLERVARTLHPHSVCIPYYDSRKADVQIPVESERGAEGCGFRSRGNGRDPSAAAYSDSCAACRLFGSLKFAGRCSISDAYPLQGHAPQLEPRNGVGIDRFTGGTVKGVLFDLQVLCGGKFQTKIRLFNFELWQLAALNLLLLDLQDELLQIGSGRSRGLGRVRGQVIDYRLTYAASTDQLKGLADLATDEEQQAYGLHPWQPSDPIPLPAAQRQGLRSVYTFTEQWSSAMTGLTPALEGFLRWHGGPRGKTVSRAQEDHR